MLDGTSKVLIINDPDSLNNDAGVTSVAISPDGRYVAAGSLDTVVRIWDVGSGLLVERLRGHRDSVYSVAFTPDGKGLVSGSLDKTLKYWDVSGLGMAVAGTTGGSATGPSTAGAGGSSSGAVVGTKVKKEGGGQSQSGQVQGKKEEKGSQCLMNFTGHKVTFSFSLSLFFPSHPCLKDYVLSVAVSHDGQWVVSGSKDRGVQFWDARSAVVQCMLQGHKNSVISIDLSPAGNFLATGSGDWQARIWSYGSVAGA
jgi:glucose repression regulatory protein TUP1